jgi:hypothetical protein
MQYSKRRKPRTHRSAGGGAALRSAGVVCGIGGSSFQGALQFHERLIPLLRNEVERMAGLLQPSALELPQTLAAHFDIAHQTRRGEDMQVLRDSLPGDVGSGGELSDRQRSLRAQDSNEAQTRRIAERRE